MSEGNERPPTAQESVVDAHGNEWSGCLPLSEAQLAKAEKEIGKTFPAELRELLLKCNGGTPARSYFESNSIMEELGDLLPVCPPIEAGRESLEDIYREQVSTVDMPPSLIPFAFDTGNAGLFCVDEDSGRVVYWVHDEPEDPVKEVAGSLGDLLSSLSEPPY